MTPDQIQSLVKRGFKDDIQKANQAVFNKRIKGCDSCYVTAKVKIQQWLRENLDYSVIIPTMWRSDKIYHMISVWDRTPQVREIIIVDNDPPARDKNYLMPDKVGYLTKGKNIYVNPAWNWGVRESSCGRIVLANDDIICHPTQLFFRYITKFLEDYDLLGVHSSCLKDENRPVTVIPQNRLTWGYGCLMFLNKDKYIHIPEEIKIARGDNIQIENLKSAAFTGLRIETKMSETIKTKKEFENICQRDIKLSYRVRDGRAHLI